ncbi:hypothetical protein V6N13_110452 [Hibiscus sabdariffa]|uniref:Uncharacterized protein n=1 Tax=Hibiscus sabdariffa TaxID=183260 RepID=A0ABR2THV3_9ROSI
MGRVSSLELVAKGCQSSCFNSFSKVDSMEAGQSASGVVRCAEHCLVILLRRNSRIGDTAFGKCSRT